MGRRLEYLLVFKPFFQSNSGSATFRLIVWYYLNVCHRPKFRRIECDRTFCEMADGQEAGPRIGSPEFERVRRVAVASRLHEASTMLSVIMASQRSIDSRDSAASGPWQSLACSEALGHDSPDVVHGRVTWQIEEERKREIAELLLIKAAAQKRAKRTGKAQPSRSLSPGKAAASRSFICRLSTVRMHTAELRDVLMSHVGLGIILMMMIIIVMHQIEAHPLALSDSSPPQLTPEIAHYFNP